MQKGVREGRGGCFVQPVCSGPVHIPAPGPHCVLTEQAQQTPAQIGASAPTPGSLQGGTSPGLSLLAYGLLSET